MGYTQSNYGPGAISTLQSGIGLTYGPTIGSTDPRVAIGMDGLGLLARASTNPLTMQRQQKTITAQSLVTTPLARLFQPSVQPGADTNYEMDPGLEPISDQVSTDDSQIIEPAPSIPTWVWVVGGIAGLGLIGGLAWWALK